MLLSGGGEGGSIIDSRLAVKGGSRGENSLGEANRSVLFRWKQAWFEEGGGGGEVRSCKKRTVQ